MNNEQIEVNTVIDFDIWNGDPKNKDGIIDKRLGETCSIPLDGIIDKRLGETCSIPLDETCGFNNLKMNFIYRSTS